MAAATQQILGDAAYSNLYGVRLAEKLNTVTNVASFGNLVANSATITTVSVNTLNGSGTNIALANASANQLLATDTNVDFVSIPYTRAATPNAVPIRLSNDYTAFTQLFLTNTSNQILANLLGQQVTLNVVAPASSRVQNINLQTSVAGTLSALAVTGSTTGTTGFTDPSLTSVQLGLSAQTSGRAGVVLDSAAGSSDAVVKFQIAQNPLWSFGTSAAGPFIIRNDVTSTASLTAFAVPTPSHVIFQTSGDLAPTGSGFSFGSATNHWNAIGLSPNLSNGIFTFGAGVPHLGNSAQVVNNPLVTPTSVVLCSIYDFAGTYVTQGTPYALVTGITTGHFTLNVFNTDSTNDIPLGANVRVYWWILP